MICDPIEDMICPTNGQRDYHSNDRDHEIPQAEKSMGLWRVVAARSRYRWEYGGSDHEEEQETDERGHNLGHSVVDVVEKNDEAGKEEDDGDEEEKGHKSHDGRDMPAFELIQPMLAATRNVP